MIFLIVWYYAENVKLCNSASAHNCGPDLCVDICHLRRQRNRELLESVEGVEMRSRKPSLSFVVSSCLVTQRRSVESRKPSNFTCFPLSGTKSYSSPKAKPPHLNMTMHFLYSSGL